MYRQTSRTNGTLSAFPKQKEKQIRESHMDYIMKSFVWLSPLYCLLQFWDQCGHAGLHGWGTGSSRTRYGIYCCMGLYTSYFHI